MDADRFDRLSRDLVRHHSRRGLTALLGGLAVGGALGLSHPDVSAAKNRRRRRKGQRRGVANPAQDDRCFTDWLFCDAGCVDPSTNDDHCGACGQSCGPCHYCHRGKCCFSATGPCTINGLPGQCLNGTCNPKPVCHPRGTSMCHLRWPYNTCCGAGICTVFSDGTTACLHKGDIGALCLSDDDCAAGRCLGYRCSHYPLGDVICDDRLGTGIGTGDPF